MITKVRRCEACDCEYFSQYGCTLEEIDIDFESKRVRVSKSQTGRIPVFNCVQYSPVEDFPWPG